jgi:hypothetical protein
MESGLNICIKPVVLLFLSQGELLGVSVIGISHLKHITA